MVSRLLFLAQLQIVSWNSRSSDKLCFAEFRSKQLKLCGLFISLLQCEFFLLTGRRYSFDH